ncbi:MAG: DUF72 domain-containing protein [Chloroflexi bacterium]|nr:DUF72 domain-containing protein [Chloroflexota bacterium]
MVSKSQRIKVGCCGFPVSMRKYFDRFRLVEVQQTFYRIPKLETALRWRQQAPPGFEFTLKASQIITHLPVSPTYRKARLRIPPDEWGDYGFFKPTEVVRQAWAETLDFARALEAKAIVFQCPPSFSETPESVANLRQFFAAITDSGFLLAWEPRGDWQESTIAGLCAELGLVHCVDPMERQPLHGAPLYFRLHGGPRYRRRYTEDELKGLNETMGDREAYVLFNNINMFEDALALQRLLASE